MWRSDWDYELRLRRAPGGHHLDTRRLERNHFQALVDDARWYACRRGNVENSAVGEVVVAPRLKPDGRVTHFDVTVAGVAGATTDRSYAITALHSEAEALRTDLVVTKRLEVTDNVEFTIHALPRSESQAPPSLDALVASATVERTPVPILPAEAPLEAWLEGSEWIGAEHARDDDPPMAILRSVLERVEAYCRRPGRLEGGATLSGRLFRDTSAQPADGIGAGEVFGVIEGTFEVQHAEREVFKLEPTTESYVQMQAQLERRRRRRKCPEEIFLGIAHAHNFLPSVNDHGEPMCPNCPKVDHCPAQSAFYSADDIAYTEAFFGGQPFGIGLVFGFTPRSESVLRAFGFRDGRVQERAIAVVDAVPAGSAKEVDHVI